jgi:hypothetical protein
MFSSLIFPFSIAVLIAPDLVKSMPKFIILPALLGCAVATGWIMMRSLTTWNLRREMELAEKMFGGLRPNGEDMNIFVLRCVDDEALLTIAAASIANRVFANMFRVVSIGWSGVGIFAFLLLWWIGVIDIPIPESFLVGTGPILFWLLLTFGAAYAALLIAGLARSSYGRELALGTYNLQINSQSTPDHSGVEVLTLYALDDETLRHSIYDHEDAPIYVAAWIWKMMQGLGRAPDGQIVLHSLWENLKDRQLLESLAKGERVTQQHFG